MFKSILIVVTLVGLSAPSLHHTAAVAEGGTLAFGETLRTSLSAERVLPGLSRMK
jgi:hypothetical protein